ncbi:DNA internalization-related competence protein ComEC/Rec2 [Undibacterium sp. Di27W]|uniref:DNA internalization-related competence protein ComEC/Rec2 n=1 Tax=Undibacterium sp. Di27W TaxID=3413036 RepID=UPI003BF2B81A
MLGMVFGVAILQQQAALFSYHWLLLLMSFSLLAALLLYKFDLRPYLGVPARFMLAAVFGFVWASGYAHFYLREELPKKWENQDIVLIGTIDSLPFRFEQGQRFNFAVEQVHADGVGDLSSLATWPSKVALSWYGADRGSDMRQVTAVQPGERWQLRVRLKRPHGNANPMGFDYEAWLLEQDLRATGTVRLDKYEPDAVLYNRKLADFVWSVGNVIESSRAKLRDRIHAALPNHPYAGVLVALVVGDQREIPQTDWTVFNRVGIGHLISISGLHITMVAGMLAGLVFYCWRHSFFLGLALPLRLPAQKAAALAGALMALVYVALAGFGLPAQRTLIMLSVVAVAIWTGRISSFSAVLSLALGLVVLADPWAVLSPGFWLSFAAVAIIVFATGGQGHIKPPEQRSARMMLGLRSASLTQYAVTIGMLPLTMFLFGQISLISPLANAIAIPLISFVVTPLALVGSILPAPLSVWLLKIAHVFVDILAQSLNYFSALPFAVWTAAMPSFWLLVLATLGILWLLAPKAWPLRWLGLVCCLPLLLQSSQKPADGELQVTALDVGQGMALLLETAHHRLLYDTGPGLGADSDSGSRVILPYLHARGINALDAMMISHNDNDHSGGALSILRHVPVKLSSTSLSLDSPIVQAASQHRRCVAGQAWDWDGVHFEVLQPGAASYESTKWKPNARSCVLRVSTKSHSMLLAGDIEAIQEDELIHSIPLKLKSDILLAPHHGSGTSSTEPFLKVVQPELAIFQVGYLNRYHHPKPEVFQRYADFGIKRLRTDESGAISIQFGASLKTSQFRQENARYWFDR